MSAGLIRYEAACSALAECKAVDEVKDWADKAAAMQAYGRMAKDKTLEVDAAEIRIRAERRLGELLAAQSATVGLNRGAAAMPGNQHTGKVVRSSATTAPTLADAGISKDLSSRAQKLAAVPAETFERELAAKRDRDQREGARVTARLEAAGERELSRRAGQPEDDDGPSAENLLDEMAEDLRRAEARVAELEKALAADGKQAVADALRRVEHAERRRDEAMKDSAAAKKRADFLGRQLARCGKAVGQTDLDKVAAAVEAMARAWRKGA